MIRRLAILAAAAARAASAAPALAGTSNVANHTEGTVSIWNNGDGHDLIVRGR